MQSLLGTELGHYRVLEELGRGSTGVVYKGVQTNLDREVAIKVLAPNLIGDQELVERFLREAKLAGKLNHPNVVHIYDQGNDGGFYYIVMEFVDGKTLRQLLGDRGRFGPERTLDIAIQACDALQSAHELGIIHRDIKGDNIIIDRRGVVKVTDFGLAKGLSSLTLTTPGAFVGSPYYVSPEQLKGEPIDFRADIYSLGRVMYRMLAGRMPFQSDDFLALIQMEMNQPVPALREFDPSIPPDLEAIVMKAQAKNREERFNTAGEMLAALKKAKASLEAAQVPVQPVIEPETVKLGPAPASEKRAVASPARSISAPPLLTEEARLSGGKSEPMSSTDRVGAFSRVFAALSYVGLFGIICLLFARGNRLVALHARQAMTLHVFRLAVVGLVLYVLEFLKPTDLVLLAAIGVAPPGEGQDLLALLGSWLLIGVFWLFAVVGLLKGLAGSLWRMPVFGIFSGKYAEKSFSGVGLESPQEMTPQEEEEKREMRQRQEERWRRYWETVEATQREHTRLLRVQEIGDRIEEIIKLGQHLNDRLTIGEIDRARFEEARDQFEAELATLKEEASLLGASYVHKRLSWVTERKSVQ